MRHEGLRRKNKPWAGAADLHYPLADSIIEKLKPFYFNQLFGMETVARFVAREPGLAPLAGQVGGWFDWKLKQESNLERELLIAVDKMLMAGHVPVKVYWDADRKRVAFDALEPRHCIVPEGTKELEEADRVTLVHQLSTEQYRRDGRFSRKEEEFVKRISGRGAGERGLGGEVEAAQALREGITHSATNEQMVIVWEVWEHTADGWMVHWISPLAPEEPLRPSQGNPFKHRRLPLVRFECEVKDKGHYSARGVPEKSGAFEQALCKYWNEKSDYMTLCNRPLFTSSQPVPNAGNLRLVPGQILPGGLSAVQMPSPPVSFDQEMVNTRMVAEYHLGMPDFGIGQSGNTRERRTATEVNQVSNLMTVGVELRARTFRMAVGALLRLAWSTLLQYDRDTRFFAEGEMRSLADEALTAEAWLLEPSGSSDTWNREAQMEKAMARKKLFAESPWIDQAELDKSILELDDARLVKRLFVDPQNRQRKEYEDEATLLPTLLLGLPLEARPEQDQEARVRCLMDFVHQREVMGAPVDAVGMGALKARLEGHLERLREKEPKRAAVLAGEVRPMEQEVGV